MFFNKSKCQAKLIRKKLIKRFNNANEILKNMEVPDTLIDREIIAIRDILLDRLYTSTIDSLAENVEQFEEVVCNYKLKVLKEGFLTKGEVGYPGIQGPMGMKGEPGESAYEIAVRHGFEGTEEEWIESFKSEGYISYTSKIDEGSKVVNKNIVIDSSGPITNSDSSTLDFHVDSYVSRLPEKGVIGCIYLICNVWYYWDGEKYIQAKCVKLNSNQAIEQDIFKETQLFKEYIRTISSVDKLPEEREYLTAYLLKGSLYFYLNDIWTVIGRTST